MQKSAAITTVEALVMATKDSTIRSIVVTESLDGVPSIRLSPGQWLRGSDEHVTLAFASDAEGLQLSSDNQVRSLRLEVLPTKRAIFNDVSVSSLGRIELAGIVTVGRVQILARDKVQAGHVEVNGLDIVAADARGEMDRPHEYGVYVLQGAFTLWNMQADKGIEITANLVDVSAGRIGNPVLGSGIFVSGASDEGGRLMVQHLQTGAVYSNGKIAAGTADQITGGIFTVFGAHVDVVTNLGPVVTYGVNDMALDNWGVVDRWTTEEKISTLGASGIGFVNFGTVRELRVKAPIETFGQGSRGFNVYTGTVEIAEFDRIVTHADGAVGVQIAQPIGSLTVRRGIETFGGTGQSLVKGVLETLSAIALSIKPGGSARSVIIKGGLKTTGRGVIPFEQHGSIDSLNISGGFLAAGGI